MFGLSNACCRLSFQVEVRSIGLSHYSINVLRHTWILTQWLRLPSDSVSGVYLSPCWISTRQKKYTLVSTFQTLSENIEKQFSINHWKWIPFTCTHPCGTSDSWISLPHSSDQAVCSLRERETREGRGWKQGGCPCVIWRGCIWDPALQLCFVDLHEWGIGRRGLTAMVSSCSMACSTDS